MTLVFTSPLFLEHQTGRHPETPRRLVSIADRLARDGLDERCPHGRIVPADLDAIRSVHAERQIVAARDLAAAGGGFLDPDTILSEQSFQVALNAAGSAMAAVDEVMNGRHPNALCLVRPPGHHATADASMGFCIFNNVAMAARHAQRRHGAGRILIVDWDVHHGNGTQDIFYDDESVTFFSIHRYPFYPGTGGAEETGSGKGLGATFNVPVRFGTSRRAYLELFADGLAKAAAHARPDLIVLSAGFDAHVADPVGSLGLVTDDFAMMTGILLATAHQYCQGRVVSCLEGGYDIEALAACVEAHLAVLHGS
jgi:acetoin utilization deacetylase AcuC-like enzyme